MKKPFIKILTILSIIFISFFVGKTSAFAATQCEWYTFESGIYYDSSSKTYKPAHNFETFSYKLEYKKVTGRDFKIGVIDSDNGKFYSKKFYSDNFLEELEKKQKCPEYIGFKSCSGNYSAFESSRDKYLNYYKTLYDDRMVDDIYDSFGRSYLYNSGDTCDAGRNIIFSSKKTEYEKELKLEKYDPSLKKTFEETLQGLEDKGKDYHYKEDFYNSTNVTWTNAIKSIKKELKTNCSSYTNSNSKNHDVYLDLIDHDVFPDLLESGTIEDYSNSKYKNKIPSEKCYNTVAKAMLMQYSFAEWFSLVDWLSLTKVDQSKDDNLLDKFYEYYEFAHLYTEGGAKVKPVYDSLISMKEGNTGVDNEERLKNDPCTAWCHNYNPDYNESINDKMGYNQCLSSNEVSICREKNKECKTRCSTTAASAYEDCYDGCMSSGFGSENYNKLKTNILAEKNSNNETITSAINDVKENLSKIKAAGLSGIQFDYKYKANCKDFKALHTIYLILEIAAPIAVIVFGSLDYAKAVMASDVEKMEKSKKKFPKRLLLLVLFVLIPIIIQIMLNLFSQASDSVDLDTNLMKCIILGK